MSITAKSLHYPVLGDFEPSRTKQSPLEETKISRILERFQLTGILPQSQRIPLSEFATEITDYSDLMNAKSTMVNAYENLSASDKNRVGDFESFVQIVMGEEVSQGLTSDSSTPVPESDDSKSVKPTEVSNV